MSGILDNLGQLIVQYPTWKYLFIALGMILQGEIASIIIVYLIINQNLNWKEYILTSLPAVLTWELLIYLTGKLLRHTRLGWRIYRKIKPNRRLQFYFFYLKKNLTKIFIIFKFLPTTNFFLFFISGWTKIKFSQFLKSYLTGLLTWFTIMNIIAYFLVSGLHYLKVIKIFRQVEIGIFFIILLILGIGSLIKKGLQQNMALQEKALALSKFIKNEIKKSSKTETLDKEEKQNSD